MSCVKFRRLVYGVAQVICEKAPGSDVPAIDKNKCGCCWSLPFQKEIHTIPNMHINSFSWKVHRGRYLVPRDLSVGQFIYVVRKRVKLPAEKAIFLFVGGTHMPAACAYQSGAPFRLPLTARAVATLKMTKCCSSSWQRSSCRRCMSDIRTRMGSCT